MLFQLNYWINDTQTSWLYGAKSMSLDIFLNIFYVLFCFDLSRSLGWVSVSDSKNCLDQKNNFPWKYEF